MFCNGLLLILLFWNLVYMFSKFCCFCGIFWNFTLILGNYGQSSTKYSQLNFFFKTRISSRRQRDARLRPWALEALLPLGELSLPGILQLWNRRFQVSGMRRRGNSCWHLVIARRDSGVAILSAEKGLLHPCGGSQWRKNNRLLKERKRAGSPVHNPSQRGTKWPMSLGSSASFRRIVPSRDTSTMESEIPSFRDAKPKQSVLAPRHCEERSDVAILAAGKDCFYTSSITPLR